jgi:hypothetical protein
MPLQADGSPAVIRYHFLDYQVVTFCCQFHKPSIP